MLMATRLPDNAPRDCPIIGGLYAGELQARIAATQEEVQAAQALRYRVFVQEMGAHVSPDMHAAQRDWDEFDPYCHHLLVVERQGDAEHVVGTYRLLRREAMRPIGTFYTAGEFDIHCLEAYSGEIMELGRSCVDPLYRSRAAMLLLWRGIATYVARYRVEIMFGCASLPGIDPAAHTEALSYLHHYHLAPPAFRIAALPGRYTEMNRIPQEQVRVRTAFNALPALVKGYLRAGAFIGHGAVVDEAYNTTDVGIVVKTDLVTAKYLQRYGQDMQDTAEGAEELLDGPSGA